jgi:transmembrane sensor
MNEQRPATASAEQRETALAAAALWRAQLDCGSADPAEFERWRAADPAHAIAFARISSTWASLEDVALPGVETMPVDEQPAAKASAVLSRRRAIAVFAGAATLAAVGLTAHHSLAREAARTSTGERRSLNLPQAVRLDMNTATAISWRASQQLVNLWLEHGEIAVRVATTVVLSFPETNPFEALLSAGWYNARSLDHALELTVMRGSAQVRCADRKKVIAVRHGESLFSASGATALQVASAQALDAIEAWQRGEVLFQDTPLSAAVAEYNRYLQRKLVILDPEVGQLRIGGRFTSADVTDFLRALEVTLRVTSVQSNGNVVLVRKT